MVKKHASGSHENYHDHGVQKTATNKSFGIVFAVVFVLIAAIQISAGRMLPAAILAVAALIFLLLALFQPRLLSPLNRVWTKFGLLLHKVTNPILMGVIFFLACTPMGVGMRLFGFDPLRRKFDPAAESYWITRDPAGPPPDSMKNQF